MAGLLAGEGRDRGRRRRGRARRGGAGRSRRSPRWSNASAPGILDADGRLDRPALAAIAFADDDGRKALGEITWPAIGEEFERQIRDAPADAVVICDVPLLVESKAAAARPYVAVVVVEAPLDLRLERLELRGVPRDDAERRMAAQATDEERRAVATHLVDNGGDLRVAGRVRSTRSGPTSSPASRRSRSAPPEASGAGITVTPRR